LVLAAEVERKIKRMMESGGGGEVRKRMEKVKMEARAALEEGGISFKALKDVLAKWIEGKDIKQG
jgi:hypothetical protein